MDRGGTSLQYGHSGTITYLNRHHAWHSQSSVGIEGRTQVLTPVQLELRSSAEPESTRRQTVQDHAGQHRFWKELTSSDPQCNAAEHLAKISAKEADPARIRDGTETRASDDLFDTAVLTDSRREAPSSYRIFAFTRGDAGDRLGLAASHSSQHGWADDRNSWLQSHALTGSSVSVWAPNLGPIRQLSFQCRFGRGEKDPLLLVLFANSIAILKPVFRERGKPVPNWHPSFYHPIGLDRRNFPLAILPTNTKTAHAAVHSVHSHLIAAVLPSGKIFVWKMVGNKGPRICTETDASMLGADGEAQQPTQKSETDSWHRIFWLGQHSVLAAVSRARMAVYEFTGAELVPRHSHVFKESQAPLRIRAACQHPSMPSVMAFATSRYIHIIHNDMHRGKPNEPCELLKWKHFLDIGAREAQLGFAHGTDDAIVLTVPELGNHLHFPLSISSLSRNEPIRLRLLQSKIAMSPDMHLLPDSNLLCIRCNTVKSAKTKNDARVLQYQRSGHEFFTMFTLDRLGNIRSCIYVSTGQNKSRPVDAPIWKITKFWSRARGDRLVSDPFVIDDAEANLDLNESSEFALASTALDVFNRLAVLGPKRDELKDLRETDLRKLYSVSTSKVPDILDFASTLPKLESNSELETYARLASELSGGIPAILDVEDASQAIQQVLRRSHEGPRPAAERDQLKETVQEIPYSLFKDSQSVTQDGPHDSTSIANAYRVGIQNWLQPLPVEAPSACRLAKERIVRFTAAALTLSSIRLLPSQQDLETETQTPRPAKSQPSSSMTEPSSSPPIIQDGASNQASFSQVSSVSLPGLVSQTEQAVQRLSRYVQVERPPAATSAMDRVLSDVLESWTVGSGADASVLQLDPDRESGIGMSKEARARELRRLEKRKQAEARREANLKRPRLGGLGGRVIAGFGPGVASSPGAARAQWNPVTDQNSAPAQAATLLDSSQTQSGERSSGPAVASQVEPGRHGGRPTGLPIRKAQRRPGF